MNNTDHAEISGEPTASQSPVQVPPPLPTDAPAPEARVSHGVAPAGLSDIFDSAATFESLGLRNSVQKGVDAAGYKYPTLVQAKLIPAILGGKDVMGQAKTGSGKTAAFGLPLLHLCERDVAGQALILCPTRELAIQITAEIEALGQFTPIKSAAIYGGDNMRDQMEELARGPQILVGTPGRVMDFAERGNIHFKNVKYVVLDEVDRMLDIGFREDIRTILEKCKPPGERQTIMVSATISDEIERLARKQMNNPEKIEVIGKSLVVSQVKQYHLPVDAWDKKKLLLHVLRHEEPALTL
ncbi:MAG: DEAD/DEAH box helicase, partial [Pyrinomonadaceae bacterium]|nr:DEAD/DEAH box helicase [Phycisphaerales bacterium]